MKDILTILDALLSRTLDLLVLENEGNSILWIRNEKSVFMREFKANIVHENEMKWSKLENLKMKWYDCENYDKGNGTRVLFYDEVKMK